jgi:hypothetical protein
MSISTVTIFVAVFLMAFAMGDRAYAYLDPGTGSVLLQVLLGGVAGVLALIKLYWKRIKSVVSRRSSREA